MIRYQGVSAFYWLATVFGDSIYLSCLANTVTFLTLQENWNDEYVYVIASVNYVSYLAVQQLLFIDEFLICLRTKRSSLCLRADRKRAASAQQMRSVSSATTHKISRYNQSLLNRFPADTNNEESPLQTYYFSLLELQQQTCIRNGWDNGCYISVCTLSGQVTSDHLFPAKLELGFGIPEEPGTVVADLQLVDVVVSHVLKGIFSPVCEYLPSTWKNKLNS
ncbi:hypothetical protein H5410_026403 [Solanum commersonii]|uniref:Uncharacterized protein n=1 Tax=Solanum commersonii TaxID=4109 RepID=A0A9J5YYW5_SOLCO|nr:hypothetical protein H5410_026403 [Solanum commersonii]